MATIEIHDGKLTVHIHGIDKLLALKSSLTVPLEHVKAAAARPLDAKGEGNIKAYRVGGTLAGSTIAGYFWATEGIGGAVQPVLGKLEDARQALAAWPNDHGGHRQQALDHVQQAIKAVQAAAQEAGQSMDDRGKGWVFFDVHDPDKAVGIDLEHETIRRVVVQVDNETPEEVVARISAALKA